MKRKNTQRIAGAVLGIALPMTAMAGCEPAEFAIDDAKAQWQGRQAAKRFIRNMVSAIRDMDWFDWFYLSFFVFASTLFWAVVAELQKEIQG